MTTYFVLCTFDRAGLQALLDDTGALSRLRRLEDDKTKLREYWLTSGAYDLVLRVEAERHADALAFLAALGSQANVATTTLTALDESETQKAMQDAHTKIVGLGGGG